LGASLLLELLLVFYDQVEVLAGFGVKLVLLALVYLFEPLTSEVTQLIAHLLAHQQLLLGLVLRHQLLWVEPLP
jgi:hypothetical protein